jgi:hypothetical protein
MIIPEFTVLPAAIGGRSNIPTSTVAFSGSFDDSRISSVRSTQPYGMRQLNPKKEFRYTLFSSSPAEAASSRPEVACDFEEGLEFGFCARATHVSASKHAHASERRFPVDFGIFQQYTWTQADRNVGNTKAAW